MQRRSLLVTVVLVALLASAQAAAAQEAPRVKAGKLLDRATRWVRPEYPRAALEAGVTGSVGVEVTIAEGGGLVAVKSLDGPEPLRGAAERAVAAWQFRPPADGEPHGDITTTLTFEFVEDYGIYYATLRRTPDTIGKYILPRSDDENGGVAGPAAQARPSTPAAPPSPKTAIANKARITNRPRPRYTEQARQNHTEGNVVVKADLLASGQVGRVGIVRGLPDGLNEQAAAAVRKLEFEPARNADGEPVDCWVTVSVTFTIR